MTQVPLVFVPGFKGSWLLGPGGWPAWLDILTAAGLRTPPLALPLDGSDGDGLVPGQPMHSISIVPGLLRRPIYGRFLDAARAWGRPLSAFGYDWRRDNGETAQQVHRG